MSVLVYKSICPICGDVHSVRTRTSAQETAPGTLEVGIGDTFVIDRDLAASRDYVVIAHPESKGELRFLEDGPVVHEQRLWTEVTHIDDRISDLKLVRMTTMVLDRLHFIAPPSRTLFWDWALDLFNPGDFNEDLDTDDDVRALRLRLRVQETLHARTFDEALLAVPTYGLQRDGEFAFDDVEGVWRLPCKTEYSQHVLSFRIEDPRRTEGATVAFGPGRSRIIPPDVFRARALATAAATPAYIFDLSDAERALVSTALDNTIEYLNQLRAFIPDDQRAVPVTEFLGDGPRRQRIATPHWYDRAWIDVELAIWQRDRSNIDTRPVIAARSVAEAEVFMRLHACPTCGTATPRTQSRVVARGDELVSLHEAACPNCGRGRQFEFAVSDEPEPQGSVVTFGDGVSEILDPGQWLMAIDQLGSRLVDPTTMNTSVEQHTIGMMVGAYNELLKFLPTSEQIVPTSIRSRSGWAMFIQAPSRFSRIELEAAREALLFRLAR